MDKSLRIMLKSLILISLIIVNYLVSILKSEDIKLLTTLFITFYIIVITYFIINNGKRALADYRFIFINVFFLYSIVSPIYYILDDFKTIPMNFIVSEQTIFEVVKKYFFTFNIFCIYAIVFSKYKMKKENKKNISKYFNEYNLTQDNLFIIYDFIAILCLLIFLRPVLVDGINIFTVDKRYYASMISSNLTNYSYYYFQAYSIYIICNLLNLFSYKLFNKRNIMRYLLVLIYWGLNLKVGIRFEFIVVFLACIVYAFSINLNIKKRHIMYIGLSVIGLLFIGVIREFRNSSNLSQKNFLQILYPMTAEFILPQYISYFYYNFPKQLILGKSYIIYSFLYLFPSFIIPNKPITMGIEFMNDSRKKGAGLAFNPIAESILNFGERSDIWLPLILISISIIVYLLKDKEPLIYILVVASSVAFCRGQFAIWITDIIFIYTILKFISLTKKRRNKIEVFNNTSNIK